MHLFIKCKTQKCKFVTRNTFSKAELWNILTRFKDFPDLRGLLVHLFAFVLIVTGAFSLIKESLGRAESRTKIIPDAGFLSLATYPSPDRQSRFLLIWMLIITI